MTCVIKESTSLNDQEQNQMDDENHQIACNIYIYIYIYMLDIYRYRGAGCLLTAPPPYVGVHGMYVECTLCIWIVYLIMPMIDLIIH